MDEETTQQKEQQKKKGETPIAEWMERIYGDGQARDAGNHER